MNETKQFGRPKKDEDEKMVGKVFYVDKKCIDLINEIDKVGETLNMKLNVHSVVREFLKTVLPVKLKNLKELLAKNGNK